MLYGDCDGVVSAPYEPFTEVLEQLVDELGPDELGETVGAHGAELRRLLPALAAQARRLHREPGRAMPTRSATACTRRSPTCSTAAGRRSPLLLVLEDVHWADAPTLLLLRHLVRARRRRADADRRHVPRLRGEVTPSLADTLVDVSRTEGVVRIRLGGLSDAEIGEFVRLTTGVEPADGAARDDRPS